METLPQLIKQEVLVKLADVESSKQEVSFSKITTFIYQVYQPEERLLGGNVE